MRVTLMHKNYDAWYGERFLRPDEFEIIKKNRDEKLKDWKNVQEKALALEADIRKLQKEKVGITNSPAKKSAEFLTMFLETAPLPDKLKNCINDLQSMVIDMEDDSVIPPNLEQIVRKIRALSITIEDYAVLQGDEGNSSAKTILDSLKEAYAEEIIAPDPKSENFEIEKKNWITSRIGKYERLQALVRSLPRYHESETTQNLSGAYIDIIILKEFDPDRSDDEINDMVRKKLSDINAVERAWNLLSSKYKFTAIFSACLAIYLDIASLLCGLFTYYITPQNRLKSGI